VGLNIMVYNNVVLTDDHEYTEHCWDHGHIRPFVVSQDMYRSLDGLEMHRCYVSTDDEWYFPVGAYSTYNKFRDVLSMTALGVKAETVWGNLTEYADKPFFRLINFADNEGIIGPRAASSLATDFAIEEVRSKMIIEWEYLYLGLKQTFEAIAGRGLLVFC
jgi:hypothetical protein